MGKTTTAVNLAAGLALRGTPRPADRRGHAGTGRQAARAARRRSGLAEVAAGEATPEQAVASARANLDLLAGGRGLASLKRLITRKDFGGEQTLAEALAPLDDAYDFAILDTAPGWDALSVNALFYAAEVLAPVSLEVHDPAKPAGFQPEPRRDPALPPEPGASATSCRPSSTAASASRTRFWRN